MGIFSTQLTISCSLAKTALSFNFETSSKKLEK